MWLKRARLASESTYAAADTQSVRPEFAFGVCRLSIECACVCVCCARSRLCVHIRRCRCHCNRVRASTGGLERMRHRFVSQNRDAIPYAHSIGSWRLMRNDCGRRCVYTARHLINCFCFGQTDDSLLRPFVRLISWRIFIRKVRNKRKCVRTFSRPCGHRRDKHERIHIFFVREGATHPHHTPGIHGRTRQMWRTMQGCELKCEQGQCHFSVISKFVRCEPNHVTNCVKATPRVDQRVQTMKANMAGKRARKRKDEFTENEYQTIIYYFAAGAGLQ